MRKLVTRSTMALVMAVASMAMTATAATAEDVGVMARSDCFDGRLCLWQNQDYAGTLGMYPQYTTGQCYSMGVMNNAASSAWNRTDFPVYVYDSSNCSGSSLLIKVNASFPDLTHYLWNDRISSFKFV